MSNIVEFNQDNVNELTEYILHDPKLEGLAIHENWGELYPELLFDKTLPGNITTAGFLYHYFQELDNFNIFSVRKIIEAESFYRDDSLEKIEIPSSIRIIRDAAFAFCGNLKEVTFQEDSQLEQIGIGAFKYCHSLKSLELPEGLRYIGDRAFYNCNSLENIFIPSSIEIIEPKAFGYCDKLKRIDFSGTISQWYRLTEKLHNTNPGISLDLRVHCKDGEAGAFL